MTDHCASLKARHYSRKKIQSRRQKLSSTQTGFVCETQMPPKIAIFEKSDHDI